MCSSRRATRLARAVRVERELGSAYGISRRSGQPPDESEEESPPGDLNPQPPHYKCGALPVELGGRGVQCRTGVSPGRVTVGLSPEAARNAGLAKPAYADSAEIACSSEPWPLVE